LEGGGFELFQDSLLSWYLPEETEEYHEEPHSGQQEALLRFEPGTLRPEKAYS
jgi:hypothetical protein